LIASPGRRRTRGSIGARSTPRRRACCQHAEDCRYPPSCIRSASRTPRSARRQIDHSAITGSGAAAFTLSRGNLVPKIVFVDATGEATLAMWRRRRRRSASSQSGSSSWKARTMSLARRTSCETRLRPVMQSPSAASASCSQASIRFAISISPSRVSS
jgi:hypothetical protein